MMYENIILKIIGITSETRKRFSLMKYTFTCLYPNGDKRTYSTPLCSQDNFKHVKPNKITRLKLNPIA